MEKLEYEARLNIPLSVGDLMLLEALSKKIQSNKTDRTTNIITKASIVIYFNLIFIFKTIIKQLRIFWMSILIQICINVVEI